MGRGIVTCLISFSLVAVFFYETPARAQSSGGTATNQFYFDETFFPVYVSKNDAGGVGGGSIDKEVPTESGLGVDARTTLGWVWNNILIGLSVNYFNIKTERSLTDDYEGKKATTTRHEYGPTLGYFLGNWRLALTYFMYARKRATETFTDPTTKAVSTDLLFKNYDGGGFQVVIGYDFVLGAGFGISPTLAYRSVSYKSQSLDVHAGSDTPYEKTDLETAAIDNELKPMITLSWRW